MLVSLRRRGQVSKMSLGRLVWKEAFGVWQGLPNSSSWCPGRWLSWPKVWGRRVVYSSPWWKYNCVWVALVLVPGVVYLDLCTLFYLNEITRSFPALFEKKINVEIHNDVSFEFVRFLLIVIIISVFSSKIIISVSFCFSCYFLPSQRYLWS